MARKRKSERQKSRKPQSSRARNRRLAQRSSQSKSHLFEALEDRRLLATLTVGNSLDLVDGDTSSVAALINSPGADGISLREAIVASNNTDGADTVTFDSNVFTGGADSLIRLTNGELEITDGLTIDGSSGIGVTITGDANGDDVTDAFHITDVPASFGGTLGAEDDLLDDNSRVLNFTDSNGDLTLSSLTITGGRTTTDNLTLANPFIIVNTHNGGGIRFLSDGQLGLTSSVVNGNSTAGRSALGGGIYTDSGNITLIDATVGGNSTAGDFADGGGIFTDSGDLVLVNATVAGNSTAGDRALGGGVYSSSGTNTLNNSIVVGNSTTGEFVGGGGIHFGRGDSTLTGSTVNGNFGGGISAGAGTLTLNNTMVNENIGGGIGIGGGILTVNHSTVNENSGTGIGTGDGQVTLNNSIVNENSSGGITAGRGTLTLNNSTVSGNSSTFSGGGINAAGALTLNYSIVSGNSTSGNNSAGGGISTGGGAITNQTALIINNSIVSGNSTSGANASGGGVFADIETFIIIDSTISGNSTAGIGAVGGGIYTRGNIGIGNALALTNSTVSGNFTLGENAGGGGIYSRFRDVTLVNSTVDENSTAGDYSAGGGIQSRFGSILLANSTVSENSTLGVRADGGGIYASDSLTLTNSTVSGNFTAGVRADGGGILTTSPLTLTHSTVSENYAAGEGGGILSTGRLSDPLTVENSIVAGNRQNVTSVSAGTPNDLVRSTDGVLTISHSLIGVADNITQTIDGNIGNQFGTVASPLDPLLGPLAFNGGPTQTHPLLPSSPAIDAGSNDLAVDQNGRLLRTDQRGGSRFRSGIVDMGAFEFDPFAVLDAPAVLDTFRDEGGVLARPDLLTTYSVSFDADVNVERDDLIIASELFDGVTIDLSAVTFSYDVATQTATWDFGSLILGAGFYSFELSDNIVSDGGNTGLDGDGDNAPGGNFIDSIYVALPGDANLDGRVDVLNDAFALVANLDTTGGATWALGDFNGDGNVDVLGDAFILIGNLGRSVAPPVSTGSVATAVAARSAGSASSTQQVVLIDDTQTTSLFQKADAETTSRLSIAAGPNSLAGSIDAAFEDQDLLDGELIA